MNPWYRAIGHVESRFEFLDRLSLLPSFTYENYALPILADETVPFGISRVFLPVGARFTFERNGV